MKRSMRKGKQILGIILAVIMMMGVIPMEGLQFVMEVYAEETTPTSGTCGKNGEDNLTWELSDDKTLTISGTGDMENWDSYSPWKNLNIKSVVITKGVTTIGNGAFAGCSNLREIVIPEGVTTIGERVFSNCNSLTEITIPDSVTVIGARVFEYCTNLIGIIIPEGVTTIGEYAFYCCSNLTEIIIPDKVTSIGKRAFCNCSDLTEIIMPKKMTMIGEGTFSGCGSLRKITIPESVTSIEAYTFEKCSSLIEITIPSSVTSIRHAAFFHCDSLEKIKILGNVTMIEPYVFSQCSSLTEVTIPNSVTSIGDQAFSQCSSLTEIIIPEGVTEIGWSAFYNCSNLTKITIPNSVTYITYNAFAGCSSLREIVIPEGVTRIESNTFSGCSSLTEITIPSGVTKISGEAFSDCSSLKEITIPERVHWIENGAFSGCSSLTEITIPSSVTSVGKEAFSGCSSLNDVYYEGSEEDWNKIHIYSNNEDLTNATIHYNWYDAEEPGTPDSSGDIQCGSFFSVEVGKYGYITAKTFADDLESLKTLTNSITWTSSDESIATVKDVKFILGSYPIKYETEQGTYERWDAIAGIRIDGISEGSTIITGKAPGCSDVTCEVTVVEPPATEEEGIGNGGSLILGEDISGSADEDSAVFEFFPANWELKHAAFPIAIEMEDKGDYYELRGSVGIGKSDLLDDDTSWDKYKKNVEDAQASEDTIEALHCFRDKYDIKSAVMVSTDGCNVLPEVAVMGYIENTYDKNWNLISGSGKLATEAKWEGSLNWQFVTPIGPLYLNLKGSGEISGKLGPKYDYNERKLDLLDGELKLTPKIALEGGYGIDKVATVGAEGSLSLPVTLIPATKGDLEAKAALNVNLVFVIDYSRDLAKLTVPLWDTTTTNKFRSKSIQARKGTEFSVGTFTEIDTSSLNDASAWNTGNRQTAKTRTRSAATDTEVTLLDGVLGGSLPMQAEVDGKRVVVFQSYDGDRTTLNSPILMYSVYENNAWSEPKAVWDTGTADMYADMKVVNGKLSLVWQKEKAETTGDVTNDSENVLKQIAHNSEICFSVFDEETNTFSDPAYVTNNDSCDMMPRICDNSDEIVLSWVRNDAADLMQEKGSNKIYTVAWNGTAFDAETELVKASGTVDDYVLYKNGDEVETIFAGQSNEMTAMFDTDGRVIEELSDLFMFSEDGSISSIQYVDGQIVCVSNGTLYAYDPADKTVETYQAGESAFGSEIQYASNGGKSGYVWSLYDEETDTGSIVASMKTEDGYSEPVTLYEKEGVIWRYVSPIINEDGNWQFVANAEDAGDGTHSLISIVKAPKTGVALAGASVDENDIVNGETGVDYFLTNTGDTPITELELTITLADGKTITKKVPVNIQPGEDAVGTAYVDLSDVDSQQKAQISISEKGQTDTEGCTVEDTIGLPDISVTGNMVEDGENVQVTAVLSNEGTVDAETSLVLFGDETQKEELGRKDKIVLKAKEKQSISFTIPKDKIVYNENDAAYLTLKAELDGGDYDESNNIAYVVLYKEKTSGPNPDDTTENPGGNVTPPTGNTGTSSSVSGNTGSTGQSQTGPVQNTNGRKMLPVGMMLTDSRTNARYVVTEAGQSVAYVKNLNKKSISAIVPSNITFGNITYKVTNIAANAFSGCKKLKSVTIGKNVITIGNNAFKKCTSLKKVIIPARVTTIGKNAFAGCKKLKNVIVKTKVLKKIGKNAFKGINKAAKIKVPKKKLTAYKKLFKKAKLAKSIKITR